MKINIYLLFILISFLKINGENEFLNYKFIEFLQEKGFYELIKQAYFFLDEDIAVEFCKDITKISSKDCRDVVKKFMPPKPGKAPFHNAPDSTSYSTSDSIYDSTSDLTYDSTTYDSTFDSTSDSIYDSTSDLAYDSTYELAFHSTSDLTYNSTSNSTSVSFPEKTEIYLKLINFIYQNRKILLKQMSKTDFLKLIKKYKRKYEI